MTSWSPYRNQPGTRRCARGTLYTPSVSGCPCCRADAAKRRKLKPWHASRRCRACKKPLGREMTHANRYLHDACRDEWQYRKKCEGDAARRARKRAAKGPGVCKRENCHEPATSQFCAHHSAQRHRQETHGRELRKALGVCKDCRKPARPGGVYCVECVLKVRESARRWREKHRPERYWRAWVAPKTWLCRACRGPVEYGGVGRVPHLCVACRGQKVEAQPAPKPVQREESRSA